MAETEEREQRIVELMDRVEGLITDAEFREELDLRQVRYLQAIADNMRAIAIQNDIIIELLKEQGGLSDFAT
jgi:hypothetical protein